MFPKNLKAIYILFILSMLIGMFFIGRGKTIAQTTALEQGCETPTVEITETGLVPLLVNIVEGCSVTWHNTTDVTYIVQSGSPEYRIYFPVLFKDGGADGRFSDTELMSGGESFSGIVLPGGTFEQVFTIVGTYDYFLLNHPEFVGQVVVEPVPTGTFDMDLAIDLSATHLTVGENLTATITLVDNSLGCTFTATSLTVDQQTDNTILFAPLPKTVTSPIDTVTEFSLTAIDDGAAELLAELSGEVDCGSGVEMVTITNSSNIIQVEPLFALQIETSTTSLILSESLTTTVTIMTNSTDCTLTPSTLTLGHETGSDLLFTPLPQTISAPIDAVTEFTLTSADVGVTNLLAELNGEMDCGSGSISVVISSSSDSIHVKPPTFGIDLEIDISRTDLLIGESITATVTIIDDSVGCAFMPDSLTLSHQAGYDVLFDSLPQTVTSSIDPVTEFTLMAVNFGVTELVAHLDGEISCIGTGVEHITITNNVGDKQLGCPFISEGNSGSDACIPVEIFDSSGPINVGIDDTLDVGLEVNVSATNLLVGEQVTVTTTIIDDSTGCVFTPSNLVLTHETDGAILFPTLPQIIESPDMVTEFALTVAGYGTTKLFVEVTGEINCSDLAAPIPIIISSLSMPIHVDPHVTLDIVPSDTNLAVGENLTVTVTISDNNVGCVFTSHELALDHRAGNDLPFATLPQMVSTPVDPVTEFSLTAIDSGVTELAVSLIGDINCGDGAVPAKISNISNPLHVAPIVELEVDVSDTSLTLGDSLTVTVTIINNRLDCSFTPTDLTLNHANNRVFLFATLPQTVTSPIDITTEFHLTSVIYGATELAAQVNGQLDCGAGVIDMQVLSLSPVIFVYP